MIAAVAVLTTGCTIETVEPEVAKEQEPEVIEKVIEFEPRTVEANYISIETKRLNVRTAADEGSEDIGDVYENEKYQVISEAYDNQKRLWYQVETTDGITGYVAGWYCAQTKISIYVEADSATIQDIQVLPMPRYLGNPFDEDSARVGDQIVGLVIKEIAQVGDLTKIVFDGEVELTGNFYHENSDLSFGRVVRFVPDEASSVLLPRVTQEINSVWFVLTDYEKNADKFGEIGTTGHATLKIKDYSIGYGTSDAHNQATLVEVTIE